MSSADREIAELKRRVTQLEAQMAFLLRSLGIEHPDPPTWEASPEILALVRQGKMAEAIKLFRQETGASLKDAKTFIETLGTA